MKVSSDRPIVFELGLSISYDRVMERSIAMNASLSEQYHSKNVVYTIGMIITAAIDNIHLTTILSPKILFMVQEYHYSNMLTYKVKLKSTNRIVLSISHPLP